MRFSPDFFASPGAMGKGWSHDDGIRRLRDFNGGFMLGSVFFLVGATKGQDIKTSKVAAGYDKMEFV